MSRRSAIGLDIGGANLKAAHSEGQARSLPFALWKEPHRLAERIRDLLASLPRADVAAVTMTGELCDCFANQAEGVQTILDSVESALPRLGPLVWDMQGSLTPVADARKKPLLVAAANWLAQATLVARMVPDRNALLIDMGSTTTDLVPLHMGRPNPSARTDPDRLHAGELCYTGARRTPVCGVMGPKVAAEFFATMADVYLVLGELPEDATMTDTADGRPATIACAHARLARMLCADPAKFPHEATLTLAREVHHQQLAHLLSCCERVLTRQHEPVRTILTSGSGSFVLKHLQPHFGDCEWIDLTELWGPERSSCACAWSLAVLASE